MWKASRSETQNGSFIIKARNLTQWTNKTLVSQHTCTIFTWMQDNSKLRPNPKKYVCQGKIYLSKSMTILQNKSLLKEYFTIIFIHLIHKTCQILRTFANQCHCLHLQSQCLYLPPSLSTPPLFHPLHWHSTTCHHHSRSLHWMYSPSQSLLVRCTAMPLWSTLTK